MMKKGLMNLQAVLGRCICSSGYHCTETVVVARLANNIPWSQMHISHYISSLPLDLVLDHR